VKIRQLALPFAIAALAAAPLAATGEARREVESYLSKVGFSAEDLSALASGQVVSESQTEKAAGEMVAIAAVRIRAPRDRVLAYFGEMIKYVDGKVTLGFGPLGTPPTPADVARLAFDRGEIDDLRSCQPGDCAVRIGGAGLQALRSAIDWNAADYAEQVNAFARDAVVRYVTAYQQRGDDALVTYDDSDQPVSSKEEWRGIVANSPYFHQYAPELEDYLKRYPAVQLPGARDLFYWIKENYSALGIVISVVHSVVYQPPSQSDRVIVAQKYIYASRYYDASLAVTTMVADEENGKPVTYLVYVNRSRGELLEEGGGGRLKRGLGGLRRTVAKDLVRRSAEQTLGTIQSVLEQAYADR